MSGVYMLSRFAVVIVIYFTLSKIAWSLHVFTDVAEFILLIVQHYKEQMVDCSLRRGF